MTVRTAMVNGVEINSRIRHSVLKMRDLGGLITAAQLGKPFVPAQLQLDALECPPATLTQMVKLGILRREGNGKRTTALLLSPDWMHVALPDLPEPTQKKFANYRQKQQKAPKRNVVAETTLRKGPIKRRILMPEIGSSLTVYLIEQDEDGNVHVGLRNGTKSWKTQVESHAELKVAAE